MKKKTPGAQPKNKNAAKEAKPRQPVTMRLPVDVIEKISSQKNAEGEHVSQADTVINLARKHL